MSDGVVLLGAVGMASIAVLLVVLGLLSRRMSQVTKSGPYYVGFFLAALLTFVGALTRVLNLVFELARGEDLHKEIIWVLLYNGAPAVGVTLGVIIAWRYWSWLLAERG